LLLLINIIYSGSEKKTGFSEVFPNFSGILITRKYYYLQVTTVKFH